LTAQRGTPRITRISSLSSHPTSEGKLYCCLIKDLFSNRIVGYSIDERMTKHLAINALRAQRSLADASSTP
jgi:putative transposase